MVASEANRTAPDEDTESAKGAAPPESPHQCTSANAAPNETEGGASSGSAQQLSGPSTNTEDRKAKRLAAKAAKAQKRETKRREAEEKKHNKMAEKSKLSAEPNAAQNQGENPVQSGQTLELDSSSEQAPAMSAQIPPHQPLFAKSASLKSPSTRASAKRTLLSWSPGMPLDTTNDEMAIAASTVSPLQSWSDTQTPPRKQSRKPQLTDQQSVSRTDPTRGWMSSDSDTEATTNVSTVQRGGNRRPTSVAQETADLQSRRLEVRNSVLWAAVT